METDGRNFLFALEVKRVETAAGAGLPHRQRNETKCSWRDGWTFLNTRKISGAGWAKHFQAFRQYYPQPHPGPVTLFRSPAHWLFCSFDPQYGWGELAQGG